MGQDLLPKNIAATNIINQMHISLLFVLSLCMSFAFWIELPN